MQFVNLLPQILLLEGPNQPQHLLFQIRADRGQMPPTFIDDVLTEGCRPALTYADHLSILNCLLHTKKNVGECRYFLQVLLLCLWGTFDVMDVAVAKLRDLRRDLDQAGDTGSDQWPPPSRELFTSG